MSLKAADGIVEERRRFTRNHVTRLIMAAPEIAPTTPPAIAPTFEFIELDVDVVESPVAVAEGLVKELYTVVKEADKVVE